MAMRSKLFVQPFAFTGDKTAIPDPAQGSGAVSFNVGWGPDYQRDQTTDPLAKPIDRGTMNYLMNAMTAAIGQWQKEAYPEWIAASDNGGTAFPYDIGTIVRYRATSGESFVNYQNLVANNTATPTAANSGWINVSRAVGSFASIDSYTTGNVAISASQAGRFIGFNPGVASCTLPLLSTLRAGDLFSFVCVGTTVTLTCQGSDSINMGDGVTVGSITLVAGDTLTLTGNANGWVAVSGSAQIKYSSQYARSLNFAGYQKVPGGLIEQWGRVTTNSAGLAVFTHPIAFPVQWMNGVATLLNDGVLQGFTVAVGAATTTATNIYVSNSSGAANGASLAVRVLGR